MFIQIDLYDLVFLTNLEKLKKVTPYLINKILNELQLPILFGSTYEESQHKELRRIDLEHDLEASFVYKKIESTLYKKLSSIDFDDGEMLLDIVKITPRTIVLNIKGTTCLKLGIS